MPEATERRGVYLRLHPDGHWLPDTPGEWDYTRGVSGGGDALTQAIGDAILWKARLDKVPDGRPNEATTCYEAMLEAIARMAGTRPEPQRVTAYECKGGLNVRFPEGREDSVRIVAPGTWEWVPPAGEQEITP